MSLRIDFDEEKHEYSVGGVKVPSVSEILAPLSAERYRDLNQSMLAQAAERGRAVHEATEAIDYGLDPEIDPEIGGYVKAYFDFIRDYRPEWEMIEGIVGCYRVKDEIPFFAGTVDRYGKIDGLPSVVDIKTYASMTTDSQLAASCQTMLYANALESMGEDFSEGFSRYILHLRKDGTYRLIDLWKWDDDHGFRVRDTAWMLYNVWHNIDTAKKTVRGKKHE